MPELDFLEVTEMRAQQEGKVSRCQAEGTSVSWVSFLTLLLDLWDDYLCFGLLAGCTADFGRQGITVELFARAVLARLTTLLALSSPRGCAEKKSREKAVFSAGSLQAELPCPSLVLLCCRPLSLVLPLLPASWQLLSYPFCPSADGQAH